MHVQEEAGLAVNPACAIRRRTTSWDHTMQMRVVQQGRPLLCSTAKKPISAPRCLGSAAMVRRVSVVA
jgi:hypothetical protein